MNTMQCIVKGCREIYTTSEPVSPNVKFVCSKHPRKKQVGALRQFDAERDLEDSKIHFQDFQFDPELDSPPVLPSTFDDGDAVGEGEDCQTPEEF